MYTTRPQGILGAHTGNYLAYPTGALYASYATSTIFLPGGDGDGVTGYPEFPGYPLVSQTEYSPIPRSAFWLFTSANTLWPSMPSIMKPLYSMSFRQTCDLRSHAYLITQSELAIYDAMNHCGPSNAITTYQYDGIEGYIMNSCPPGFTCDNDKDPSEPQLLYRVHNSDPMKKGSALLTESQKVSPNFPGYTLPQPGLSLIPLGYVFPNVDSDGDGLPDGMERMYGLNRFSTDSDCDGISDGVEFPIAAVQPVGLDPLSGGCK